MSYSNLSTMFCVKKFKRKKDEEDESSLGLWIGCCSTIQNDHTLHTHVLSLLPLHQHP